MMIAYESKLSKFLAYFKYLITIPAIVFAILYWVKNNELFLTLVFACMSSYLLCAGVANLNEIRFCLRNEEKGALKFLGFASLLGCLVFLIVIGFRVS